MLLECSDDWFFFQNTRMHWMELLRTCTRLFNGRLRTGKFSNCIKQVHVQVQPPLDEDGEEDDGVQLRKDGEKTWIYGWAKGQQYCRRWFTWAVQWFTSWTSADVHIMLLVWPGLSLVGHKGITSIQSARTAESSAGQERCDPVGKVSRNAERSKKLTPKAHVPKENAKGETWWGSSDR